MPFSTVRRHTNSPSAHHKPGDARAGLLYLGQYRIILSADTASEVRQMPSQKRR